MRNLILVLVTLASLTPVFGQKNKAEEGGLLDGIGIWKKEELQRHPKEKLRVPYSRESDVPAPRPAQFGGNGTSDPREPVVVTPTKVYGGGRGYGATVGR